MRENRARKSHKSHRARPSTIEFGKLSDEPQVFVENEPNIDECPWTDGCNNRDPFGRSHNQCSGSLIKRFQQLSFCQVQDIAAIDDRISVLRE